MIRKKLVRVGGSKAVIIPNSYLNYWKLKGKIIQEFGVEINKKLILEPIFKEINKKCFSCEHFKFDWASRPLCALGKNIFSNCFEIKK